MGNQLTTRTFNSSAIEEYSTDGVELLGGQMWEFDKLWRLKFDPSIKNQCYVVFDKLANTRSRRTFTVYLHNNNIVVLNYNGTAYVSDKVNATTLGYKLV